MILIRCLAVSAAIAALAWVQGAGAQTWPERPVRLIVPVQVGSATDIAARLLSEKLAAMWGQPIVVDNRAGSGGVVGLTALVGSKPDGYAFGFLPGSTVLVSPLVYKEAQFNIERDLMPVAPVAKSPFMIAVSPKSGIQSMSDLVSEANKQPDKLNMAVLPINTAVHLGAELIKSAAKLRLQIIPYKGAADALASVVSGETQVTLSGVPPIVPFMKGGTLRVIGVTTKNRLPEYGAIPAVSETIPGFEFVSWWGIFAPAGTPAPVVDRINRDVGVVLRMADIQQKYLALAIYADYGPPAALKELMDRELPMWSRIVREVGSRAK